MGSCFSKILLVRQKNIETKHLQLVQARFKSFFSLPPKHDKYGVRFLVLVGYNIVAQPIRTQH